MIKKVFPVLALVAFSSMLGDGIIAPMLPIYAEEMGATVAVIGVIFATFSISRAVLTPLAGWMSDRRGRKMFICVGLFIYAAVSLGYVWADDVSQIIIVRLVHGAASGMILPIAQAYIGDISPEGEEGRWMGYFNAAFFAGFGIGPLMGGILTDRFGMDVAFYTMGGINMAAFIGSVSSLPEVGRRKASASIRLSFKEMSASGMIKGLLVFRFAYSFGAGVLLAFLPIFVIEYLGLNPTLAGLLLTVNILLASLLQVYSGKVADRISRRSLVILGSFISVAFIGLIPVAHNFWQLFGVSVLGGVGGAVALPAAGALMVEEGRRYGMGSTVGIVFLGMSVGIITGSILGGKVSDSINIDSAFYLAALIGFIGANLFAYFTRSR